MKRSSAALLVLLSWNQLAPAVEPAPSGDLARLQGGWVANAGPNGEFRVRLDVEGRRVKVKIALPGGLSLAASGELSVDESASPRSLDWVRFSAPDGSELPEIQGIYEFKDGSLRVCNGGPNNGRPTTFTDGDGPLASVVLFERAGASAK
ncbi:TIGR03067 domain-containing protein [Tundrisphaera sp. TA3]|uniref:TIGR03067 domain-containing protein n=1 Tax=Tundrisphaera sp. TA3 TaxID=3435775 RepID=UPI003EB8BC6E